MAGVIFVYGGTSHLSHALSFAYPILCLNERNARPLLPHGSIVSYISPEI